MPTTPGIPLDPTHDRAAINNPWDWIDGAGNQQGALQSSLMRGTGGALAWWQRRTQPQKKTIPQAREVYLQGPTFDRGASAFAPKFGTLPISPIGAGVYAPYRIPTIAGPGARYVLDMIWFDVQTVPTSLHISPTMSAQQLNDLIATSYVAAMYPEI